MAEDKINVELSMEASNTRKIRYLNGSLGFMTRQGEEFLFDEEDIRKMTVMIDKGRGLAGKEPIDWGAGK